MSSSSAALVNPLKLARDHTACTKSFHSTTMPPKQDRAANKADVGTSVRSRSKPTPANDQPRKQVYRQVLDNPLSITWYVRFLPFLNERNELTSPQRPSFQASPARRNSSSRTRRASQAHRRVDDDRWEEHCGLEAGRTRETQGEHSRRREREGESDRSRPYRCVPFVPYHSALADGSICRS
jgi:hypothetical protein